MVLCAWLGVAASAGQVFVTVETWNGDIGMRLHLPAVFEDGAGTTTTNGGKTLDLVAESAALASKREGKSKRWKLENDGRAVSLTLSHEACAGSATTLYVTGSNGSNDLDKSVPLAKAGALLEGGGGGRGKGRGQGRGQLLASLDHLPWDFKFDESAAMNLLEGCAPTTVLDAATDSGTVHAETR